MSKICIYLLFLISALCSLILSVNAQPLRFSHLTIEQALPSNTVYTVFKDADGFIWCTTRSGLCRYDGYSMKVFTSDPLDTESLSGNNLYAEPHVDRDGNIWIGTRGSGLNRYNRITGKFTRFMHDPLVPGSIDNDDIWTVYQDREGTIWVGTYTALNKLDSSSGTFQSFNPMPDHPKDPANLIYSILEDSTRSLWIASGRGVFRFDRDNGIFIQFEPASPLSQNLNSQKVFYILRDSEGDYWFAAEMGLFHYRIKTQELSMFSPKDAGGRTLSGTMVYHVLQDPIDPETFWITSMWGLNRLNIETGEIEWILNDPGDPLSIGSNAINWTYIDETGKLWVATGNAGIAVADLMECRSKNPFIHIKMNPVVPDTLGYSGTTFLKDPYGDLWAGTAGGGLFRYDPDLKLESFYHGDNQDSNPLKNAYLFDLYIDSRGNFLIGTYGQGLINFDISGRQAIPIETFSPDSSSRRSYIHRIYEDKKGVLWIGTGTGLYYCDGDITSIVSFNVLDQPVLSTAEIMSIMEDMTGDLWIGTAGMGLYCLPDGAGNKEKILHFEHNSNEPGRISSNVILCTFCDSTGCLWIGTDRGLNRFSGKDEGFETILFPDDPAVNFIYAIEEDRTGQVYLQTEAGLVRFDPDAPGRNYRIFTLKDGLAFDSYGPFSLYCDSEGRMYIGSTPEFGQGFLVLYPDRLEENTHIPSIVFTDFKVMNQSFEPDSCITIKKHISLDYDQNFISFEFSALDFKDPVKNQYACMLEGVDNDWIYCGSRRFANYTDLRPGNYIFRVKGSNNDGLWNEAGNYIGISVLPPPWKTWWAYSLYGLFLIGLFVAWRRYDLKRLRLKHELELEHVEALKLKELDSLKSRFFANISHEFRTPLTLILGPLQKLFSTNPDEETKQELNLMQRNARRLQNLINQLLDLSKLESGKMELNATEENIAALVKSFVQQFESLAKHKGITLEFHSERDDIPAWVDHDKIGKILYNLLSNAFKWTGEGGRIEVSVSGKRSAVSGQSKIADRRPPTADLPEKCILISISDTGAGIAPEKLPHIFDRFYQAGDSYAKDGEGTGIGLALTKELVELHGGTITVESVVNRGSTFRVFFPIGNLQLKSKSKEQRSKIKIDFEIDNRQPTTDNQEPAIPPRRDLRFAPTCNPERENQNAEPMLLIVEDNPDMRLYIRGILGQDYQVLEAGGGRQGLEKALEHVPDLVLTDVMMPEMDGYELSRKLKNDERTSHIPIILLTARASMESKIEGLETGADDFITKPFVPQELQVRIHNLIEQRNRLKALFRKNLVSPSQLSDSSIASMDKRFMQKAVNLVEQHMADPDLSVEFFSSEMALSRGQLHRKLKALIDQSPNDFIRTIRLNRAASLLQARVGNIAEIAYDVGFNNPSYFTECFRKQFGCLPSEYQQMKSR